MSRNVSHCVFLLTERIRVDKIQAKWCYIGPAGILTDAHKRKTRRTSLLLSFDTLTAQTRFDLLVLAALTCRSVFQPLRNYLHGKQWEINLHKTWRFQNGYGKAKGTQRWEVHLDQ